MQGLVADVLTGDVLDAVLDSEDGSHLSAQKQDGSHKGFFVALWLDPIAAEALALDMPGAEPADSLHVTLAYVTDWNPQAVPQALHHLRAVAQKFDPLEGIVGGHGRFMGSAASDGKEVVYATPDVKQLSLLRDWVASALRQSGLGNADGGEHGWSGHCTLAYVSSDTLLVPDILPVPLRFDSLHVRAGEAEPVTIPLGRVLKANQLHVHGDHDLLERAVRPVAVAWAGKPKALAHERGVALVADADHAWREVLDQELAYLEGILADTVSRGLSHRDSPRAAESLRAMADAWLKAYSFSALDKHLGDQLRAADTDEAVLTLLETMPTTLTGVLQPLLRRLLAFGSIVTAATAQKGGRTQVRALKYPKDKPLTLPPEDLTLGQQRYVWVTADDAVGSKTGIPTCARCLYMADVGSFRLADAVAQMDQFLEAADNGFGDQGVDNLSPFPSLDEIDGFGVKDLTALGILLPPIDPYCLPSDMRVVAGGITATSVRRYQGELVIIRTSTGYQLAVTPNHPILTDHGWVASGMLVKGDHVVCTRSRDTWMSNVNSDDADVPAPIQHVEETFGRTCKVASKPVPVSAPAFHGDGVGSEIAIIRTNRLLRDQWHAASLQHCCQFPLAMRKATDVLNAVGYPFAFFNGDFATPDRIMRSSSQTVPFLLARAFHALKHRRAASARLDAVAQQAYSYHGARDAIAVGQDFLGHTSQVFPDNGFHVDAYLGAARKRRLLMQRDALFNRKTTMPKGLRRALRATRDAMSLKNRTGIGVLQMIPTTERVKSVARDVFLDKLALVQRRPFHGDVYSLETEAGCYLAEGLVVSNCRCSIAIV